MRCETGTKEKRERGREGQEMFSQTTTPSYSPSLLLIRHPCSPLVFTVIVEYGDVTASENGSALTRATLGGPESLDADRGSARRNSISRPCPSSACSTCGQCQLPILHLGGRREGNLPKILLSGALINNWGISRLLGDGR